MNFENTLLIICTAASFFLGFGCFYILNRIRIAQRKIPISPFVIILGIFAVFALGLSIAFRNDNDFINEYVLWELPALLAASGAIFYVSSRFGTKYICLTILSCAAFLSLFMPQEISVFSQIRPFFTVPLIILLWFLFSFLYRFLNGIETVAGLHAMAVCIGIFFLTLAAALPFLLGAIALILAAVIAAFLIFNWYPARLQLSEAGCTALGFLLGGLVFRAVSEGAAPSIVIFNMFYIIEISWALLQTLFLRDKYADVVTNTAYFQANVSGLSPENITNNILRLEIVMIVLGYFEVYSANIYSIPVLSAIITAWYLSKVKNWQDANQSFRDMNRNVINEIKNNFEEIKDTINKDKEN